MNKPSNLKVLEAKTKNAEGFPSYFFFLIFFITDLPIVYFFDGTL